MTNHPSTTTTPSFGLWGPPAPEGAQPATVPPPPVRARLPWGMGQVWVAVLALLALQVAILPLVLFEAVRSLGTDTITEDTILQALSPEALSAATGTATVVVGALVLQWAAFVGVPWLASRRSGLRSMARDFGLRFCKWDPLLGLALAAGLQLLMIGIGWVLAHTGLDLSGADNTNLVTDHDGAMLVMMIAAAAIGAPFTEEILFRGLTFRALLRSLVNIDLADDPHFADRVAARRAKTGKAAPTGWRRKAGIALAALGSAAFFGIMHMPMSGGTNHVSLAAQIILPAQTGLLGLIFAVVAYKTRRLGVNICAHVAFNSTSLALVLLTR